MKKLITLAILSVLFTSCGITTGKYMVNSYTIDYTQFTEKNFFITEANAVSFDYMPIGSITVESVSGNVITPAENSEMYYDKSEYKSANLQDAFQMILEVGIKKGANGVINIKMEYHNSYNDPETKILISSRWVVTGMLILK